MSSLSFFLLASLVGRVSVVDDSDDDDDDDDNAEFKYKSSTSCADAGAGADADNLEAHKAMTCKLLPMPIMSARTPAEGSYV